MIVDHEIREFLYREFEWVIHEENPKLIQLFNEIDELSDEDLETFFDRFCAPNNRYIFCDLAKLSQYFAIRQILSSIADESQHLFRISRVNPFIQAIAKSGKTVFASLNKLSETFSSRTVFTGHPTEFASDVTIALIKELIDLVIEHEDIETINRKSLHNKLLKLFNSNLTPSTKLSVEDEITRNLKHLEYIYGYLPQLRKDLFKAFTENFGSQFDKSAQEKLDMILQISIEFRSWTGGDADGNFRVISDKMARAVNLHKHSAAKIHLHYLHTIISKSTDSNIKSQLHALEPLIRDLNLNRAVQVLEGITEGTSENLEAVRDFIFLLKTFGKDMASIDVRQNSQVLGSVVANIISGITNYLEDKDLLTKDESNTLSTLKKCHYETYASNPAKEVERLSTLNIILENQTIIDLSSRLLVSGWFKDKYIIASEELSRMQFITVFPNIFQNYIISNCEDVSCILEVVFLAKVCSAKPNITPLFESKESLESAITIIDKLLDNPHYTNFLKDRNQKVMIGYSDSQKESGTCILPNIASLLESLSTRSNIEVFHGNGLDIGRGGPRIIQEEQTFQGRHIRYTFMHYFEAREYYSSLMENELNYTDDDTLKSLKKFTDKGSKHFSNLRSDDLIKTHFSKYLTVASPFELFVRPNNFSSRASQRHSDDLTNSPYNRWFQDLVVDTSDILSGIRAIPWILTLEGSYTFLNLWYGFLPGIREIDKDKVKELYEKSPVFKDLLDKVVIGLTFADFELSWKFFPKEVRGLQSPDTKLSKKNISGTEFLTKIHTEYSETSKFIKELALPVNKPLVEVITFRQRESFFLRSLIAWLNLNIIHNNKNVPDLFPNASEPEFQKMCGALFLGFTEYRTIPKTYLN